MTMLKAALNRLWREGRVPDDSAWRRLRDEWWLVWRIWRGRHAEREQLQKILDNSPVGVSISTDNVVRFANPRFTELFDRRVGQSAQDAYVNPDDRRQILAELERSGIVRDVELKTYGPGGKICDTLATFIRTEYEGRTGVLAWMVDLSGPKKAERELKERLDELARFRRLAIGREQKMIELKKEINELLKGTDHAEKYKIH